MQLIEGNRVVVDRTCKDGVRSDRRGSDGLDRVEQKRLAKAHFAGRVSGARALQCAKLKGLDLHKRILDGRMVFGGR